MRMGEEEAGGRQLEHVSEKTEPLGAMFRGELHMGRGAWARVVGWTGGRGLGAGGGRAHERQQGVVGVEDERGRGGGARGRVAM